MKAIIDRLIREYGNDVLISSGNAATVGKVFLQLVTSKSWQNMERMFPTGGEVPRGQFLFIATANTRVRGADAITMDDRTFIVRRADPVIFKGEHLFIWGLCVEGGGADPWMT